MAKSVFLPSRDSLDLTACPDEIEAWHRAKAVKDALDGDFTAFERYANDYRLALRALLPQSAKLVEATSDVFWLKCFPSGFKKNEEVADRFLLAFAVYERCQIVRCGKYTHRCKSEISSMEYEFVQELDVYVGCDNYKILVNVDGYVVKRGGSKLNTLIGVPLTTQASGLMKLRY